MTQNRDSLPDLSERGRDPDAQRPLTDEMTWGEVQRMWAVVYQRENVRLRAENATLKEEQVAFVRALEKAQAENEDKQRRLEPDGAGGFRWEAGDANEHIVWLRNQMGDVRGMQSDGATPEEMDEALGRALRGKRARQAFDEARSALTSDEEEATDV